MTSFRPIATITALVCLASVAPSCGSDENPPSSFGNGGTTGTSGTSTGGNAGAIGGAAGAAGSSAAGGTGGSPIGGAGGMTGAGGTSSSALLVYGSTDTTLYSLDPDTLAITKLGDFDCIGTGSGQYAAMTDIAVNAQGEIWGLSAHFIHQIQVMDGKAHCAKKTQLKTTGDARFYALSFAPAGVLDSASEVLVAGNTAGELWSIDDEGNVTLRGNFGTVPASDGHDHDYAAANVGKPWELSGDIVFSKNGDTPLGFATVRDCPSPPDTTGCNYTNTLLQIDMTALGAATPGPVTKSVRGQIVASASCNGGGWGNFWGIAAWNDRIFGFSRSGNIVDIANTDGTGCDIPGVEGAEWSGAGVTTLVPVVEPIQ